MKAQVLLKYDDNLTAPSWVDYIDVPDPVITKGSDVIVRIGGAGVCRTDLHVIEGIWRPHMPPPVLNIYWALYCAHTATLSENSHRYFHTNE